MEKQAYHGKAKITMPQQQSMRIAIRRCGRKPVLSACKLLLCLGLTALGQGLGPGANVPGFSLPDQNGTSQTFDSIRGSKGAMIVFYRSADW
jgi:hypothetical protein